MAKLPDYCYLVNKEKLNDATYIACTQLPFIVGKVWMFKNEMQLAEKMEIMKPLGWIMMETHAIGISTYSILGERIIVHAGTKEEIQRCLKGMLDFFVDSRVNKNYKYYEKFIL